MSEIIAIVAVDNDYCIGKNNEIPWYLPADLQYFKRTTIGYPVIMGRKSFDSIGRPLPKRTNIVITRDPFFIANDILVAHSIEEAIEMAESSSSEKIFIIGGGHIYSQTEALWDKVYLTRVDTHSNGDTYFPKLSTEAWDLISEEKYSADDKNPFNYTFQVLKRKA
jgi:dihydrofolate reductase